MYAARVEGALNVLPSIVSFKSDLEVVHLITRRISSHFYDVEHITVVFPPTFSWAEMEENVRAFYANDMTKTWLERKFGSVVSAPATPTVVRYVFVVRSGFQGNSPRSKIRW